MKHPKTFFLTSLLLASFLFSAVLSPTPISAQKDPSYGLDTTVKDTGILQKPLAEVIGTFIKAILTILGLILLIIIVYAGILWLTSGGEEEKLKKAKAMLINAVIGLLIIIAAYALTWFIMSKVTGTVGGVNSSTGGTSGSQGGNPL